LTHMFTYTGIDHPVKFDGFAYWLVRNANGKVRLIEHPLKKGKLDPEKRSRWVSRKKLPAALEAEYAALAQGNVPDLTVRATA